MASYLKLKRTKLLASKLKSEVHHASSFDYNFTYVVSAVRHVSMGYSFGPEGAYKIGDKYEVDITVTCSANKISGRERKPPACMVREHNNQLRGSCEPIIKYWCKFFCHCGSPSVKVKRVIWKV